MKFKEGQRELSCGEEELPPLEALRDAVALAEYIREMLQTGQMGLDDVCQRISNFVLVSAEDVVLAGDASVTEDDFVNEWVDFIAGNEAVDLWKTALAIPGIKEGLAKVSKEMFTERGLGSEVSPKVIINARIYQESPDILEADIRIKIGEVLWFALSEKEIPGSVKEEWKKFSATINEIRELTTSKPPEFPLGAVI